MLTLISIVVIFAVAAVILFAVLDRQRKAKRRKELAAWAQAKGLSFRPSADSGIDDRFQQFKCLRQGDGGRYGYNIMEGIVGRRAVCAFDYHYETHTHNSKGGRSTHHHHFSAVVVGAGLPLKPLFIRTETFVDKMAEFVGFDDIDFESTEFSRQFLVKSPDRRWAYDVLHQATMEFLLNSPRFTLEFQGSRVIAYRGKTLSTADFEAALQVVTGILDRLPASLLSELSQSARGGQA